MNEWTHGWEGFELFFILISVLGFIFYNSKAHWMLLGLDIFFLHVVIIYLNSDLYEYYSGREI